MPVPSMALLAATGGGAWTPASLSGLRMWYDFSDTATITDAGSGAVSQVTDKSGNGKTLTQSTSTARPTTGAATQNGLNVLTFDGGDYLVAGTAADWKWMHDGAATVGLFVAYKWASGANSTLICTNRVLNTQTGVAMLLASSGANLYHYSDATPSFVAINNRAAYGGRTTSPNLAVIIADHGNATVANRSRLRANGAAVTGDNASTGTPSASNPYTALRVGSSDGSGLNGQIFEVFGCTSPSQVDWEAAEAYMIEKWGIT